MKGETTTQGNYTKYAVQALQPLMLKQLKRFPSLIFAKTGEGLTFNWLETIWKGQNVIMARKSNKQSGNNIGTGSGRKSVPTVWKNYRLQPEDIPAILEESGDHDSIAARISQIFVLGADFSLKCNPERGNWSAFIIEPIREGQAERIGISAFGGDQWQALACVLFKMQLFQHSPDLFAGSGSNLGIG